MVRQARGYERCGLRSVANRPDPPGFIPVIGYLDELVILPVAIVAVVKLIPPTIMAEHRAAAAGTTMRPRSIAGAIAIVLVWLAGVAAVGWLVWRYAG